MKLVAMILVLGMILSPVCLAETSPEETSSADRFLSDLTKTWESFLGMTEDAAKGVTEWAEQSGVAEWAEQTYSDIAEWAKESGLTDWAGDTLNALTKWFDESGITEWATQTTQEIQAFYEENRPEIEAWLAAAGEEVRHAWDTLVNADQHTPEEVQAAYDTVEQSLEAASQ